MRSTLSEEKNILKFVSLLGIGSFVMLAAASCTSATTPTPNPEPNPNPNPEPKPDPMPNPPSGGMNGGNTNPGNGRGMTGDNPNPGNTTPEQQLAAARKTLTDLLGTENTNVALYADYAKIKNDLTAAYTTAKSTSDNTSATLEQVKSATSTLQTAIDAAASEKKTFDAANPELVKFYNEIQSSLSTKTTNLETLKQPQYNAILSNLTTLYEEADKIVNQTLVPASGTGPTKEVVQTVNTNLKDALNTLNQRKTNANNLFNGFEKNLLIKTSLTSGSNSQDVHSQPGNYSFVGFSVDVTNSSANNLPNWDYAQRMVWTTGDAPTRIPNNTNMDQSSSSPLSQVAWIYSLSNTGAKYTLDFNYYGPSTGYLYFPYKLVKDSDKNKVALQYSLNGAHAKEIKFKTATETQAVPAQEGASATHQDSSSGTGSTSPSLPPEAATPGQPSTEAAGSPARSIATNQGSASADQPMPETTAMNEAPTVDSINVAKVTLTDLKFGQNTIEFSVPTDNDKVAPMIGNMYLTSSDAETNKQNIENSIFGNSVTTENNRTIISVDALNGYSLASDWSTYIAEYSGAGLTLNNENKADEKFYLIGFVGGKSERNINSITNQAEKNVQKLPSSVTNQNSRTYTFYVNAPKAGDYYIKGVFASGDRRDLKFSTGDMSSNNVTVKQLSTGNLTTTLKTFDTSATAGSTKVTTDPTGKKTLTLVEGLNKIVVSGTTNENHAPFVGNLTFTLNNVQTTSNTSESNDNTAPAA
ncbi:hypothetical protein SE856_03490 [Mycoplasmoides gallisepticum]|nr:hypothetical protein SE856_03490 [Mycoplasmoides gallisepticum]